MAGEPPVTIIGNLVEDPTLRFTPSGAAVASINIASTPRTYNRQTQQWEDGETLFMRGSVWRDAAENVAESLTKGMRVIATGELVSRSYTTRDGQNRTVVEMRIEEIGPSLKFAQAQVQRRTRGQQGGNYQGQQQGQWGSQQPQQGQQGQQGGWNNNQQSSPQGGQGGYSQGGQQGSYNAPQGGAQDAPWATGPSNGEPPF